MSSNPEIVIRATDRTRAAFGSVGKGLQKLKGSALNVKSAVLALAGVGGFGVLIAASYKSIDANAKWADSAGITTQAAAGLMHQATLTGVGIEQMQKGMVGLNRRVSEAAAGMGEARIAFKDLNLDATALNQLPVDRKMEVLADALGKVENHGDRTRIAVKLFGEELGGKMLNYLAGGSAGLRQAAREAEAMGLALNRVDAAKIEGVNDSVARAQGAIKGVSNTIAVQLSPYLNGIADAFVNAAIEGNGFRDTIKSGMDIVRTAVGYVGDAFWGWQAIWGLLKVGVWELIDVVWQGMAALDTLITDTLNKIPGAQVTYNTALQGMADWTQGILETTRADMDATLNRTPPSDAIDAWFKQQEAKYTAHAQRVAGIKNAQIGVEKKSGTDLLAVTKDGAGKMFGIQKELSIATILVKAPQAIAAAFSNAGGYPMGIGAAFATAAKMGGELATAAGVSFGGSGGGGGGSIGSSTTGGGGVAPAPAPVEEAAPTRRETVVIHGLDPEKMFSGQQVRELMDRMYDTENTGVSFA